MNKQNRKSKRRQILLIALLLIGISVSVESVYVRGDFWSTIDNTLVTTVEGNHVNIGENETTPYMLNVVGTTYFKGTSIVNGSFIVKNPSGVNVFVIDVTDEITSELDGSFPILTVNELVVDDDFDVFAPESHFHNDVLIEGNTNISGELTVEGKAVIGDSTIQDAHLTVDARGTNNDETFELWNDDGDGSNRHNIFNFLLATDSATRKNSLQGRKSGGTIDSPTDVDPNEEVFMIASIPYRNGAFRLGASITFETVSDFSDTSYGERIVFRTTVAGSTAVRSERFRIDDDGSTKITGDLIQSGGDALINLPYAEIWFHEDDTSVTTSIDVQDRYYNITGFDGGDSNGEKVNGFMHDGIGNITCLVDGLYSVVYDISFGNAGNNEEYQLSVFVNGVEQANSDSHRKIGAGGDVGKTGDTSYINLSNGDVLSLRIKDNDGTADVLTHACSVNIMRIGN